jgi:thiol-disulfide isomerase/thioredoxin
MTLVTDFVTNVTKSKASTRRTPPMALRAGAAIPFQGSARHEPPSAAAPHAMADPTPDTASDDSPEAPRPPKQRRLDNRTIAICVCIALLASLLAALAVSIFGGNSTGSTAGSDDSSTPRIGLTQIDPNAPAAPPTGTIQGLTGEPFTFADLEGKPVVVNFFSSTCAPCLKEMPAIEQLHAELGDQVQFVGIDVLDTRSKAQDLVTNTGVTYRTGWDPNGDIVRALNGQALPTTVLIGSDGKVIDAHTGAFTKDELRQYLTDHALLGGTTTNPSSPTSVPTTAALPSSTPP